MKDKKDQNIRVLFISAYFPPDQTIASLRTGKFAKYLAKRENWVIDVICAETTKQRNLEVEVPKDAVHLVEDFSFSVRQKLKSYKNKILKGKGESRNSQTGANSNGFFRKIKVALYPSEISFPDKYFFWMIEARKVIKSLVKKNNYDVVFTSAGPVSSTYLGYWVNKKYGLPWIADFRDLWSQNHVYANKKFKWFNNIEKYYEKKWLKRAGKIVTVSKPLADQMKKMHNRDIFVINNGFDPEDFKEIKASLPEDKFVITYTGLIYYPEQDPGPMFEAMRILKNNSPELYNRTEVHFYVPDLNNNIFQIAADLNDAIYFHEPVTYQRCLEIQKSSSALLVLEWNDALNKGILTGKVFEYMAAGRPIISIGSHSSSISELLNETGRGVSLNSPQEIAEWITRSAGLYFSGGESSGFDLDDNRIAGYTRENQANVIMDLISEMADAKNV